MKESCKQFQAEITDYARGGYKYIKDYHTLFNHLRTCAECRNKLFGLEEVCYHLRAADGPSPEFQKKMTELREQFRKGPPPLTAADKEDTPLKRGIALFKQRKCVEAKLQFDEAVKQAPKDANTYYHRGLVEEWTNDLGSALTDFTRALGLDPDDADAYYHRAGIYHRQGQFQPALNDYTRAIQLNPDYEEAYCGRAQVYSSLKEYDKSVTDFTRFLSLGSKNVVIYVLRGMAYLLMKQSTNALRDFNQALDLGFKDAFVYYCRGLVYFSLNKLEEAISDFKKTLEIGHSFFDTADTAEWLKKAEQELEVQRRIKKVEDRYQQYVLKMAGDIKEKDKLETKYEAEIKELKAKIKFLEEERKTLIEIAKTRPEYHYHITTKELPGIVPETAESEWIDAVRRARINLPPIKFE